MKKFFTICLIALLIIPMAFAAKPKEVNPAMDKKLAAVTDYNMPLTPRAKAMGGAGLAMPGRADAFFMNPAGFAKRVGVFLPSVDVTVYHPYDLLSRADENSLSIVDALIEGKDDPDAMTKAVPKILGMIKNGRGKLMDVNAAVAFDFAGFAFGVNVNDALYTFGNGSGNVDSYLFDELNVTANVGLGLRFKLGDKMWIDAGANVRPTYKAYSMAIGAPAVQDALDTTKYENPADYFMKDVTLAAGFGVPFDLGLNFSGSWWSVGIVGRNILGTYNMKSYDSIDQFSTTWSDAFSGKDFKIDTPWSLDFGFGFKWDNAFFKPTLVCDVVDIVGMCTVDEFTARTFMEHLKVGAELRLLSFLDVRAGLSEGYWSLGAGLDLAIIKVDLAYYWSEFGDQLGDYGLDALSVRVNVGFDR